MRISSMKRFCSSAARFDIRPSVACSTQFCHTGESKNALRSERSGLYSRRSLFDSSCSNRLLENSLFRHSFSLVGVNPLINPRLFSSSSSEAKGSIPQAASETSSVTDSGVDGNDLIKKFNELWQSTVDSAKNSSEKVKDASNEVAPQVQQWLDTHPYLRDVIVPVGCTLAGIMLAWSLLPRLLRRFHKYSVEGPGALFSKSSLWRPVPYEQSFWGALESPARYFITLMAFLEIGEMVAPNTIASQYATQACRGAFVVSVVWFLHRWKSNVIARALATADIQGVKKDQLLALDRISSVGLLMIGSMALAEAFGVAVQSVLTVGGIGGVATAFAARDVLGNVLSGLSVQFTQPFSIGDMIKAGSVEGKVIEMGLTTTSLLTAEKFPVIVPNSLFSSQAIVNKSRAKWLSMVQKVPLQIDDIDKISQITEDIKSMLRSNSNVFLEEEPPYCYLSQIELSYAELTLGCNLKKMSKETEHDILSEAVRIIKRHGVMLGSSRQYG